MSDHHEMDEKRELDRLPREVPPSPELEERIVGELRARGLISHPRGWGRRALAAATVLLAAGAGWWGRGLLEASSGRVDRMAGGREYLLLLTEEEGAGGEIPLEEQVAEYARWAERLAEGGHLIAAARLEEDGRLLSPAAPQAGVTPRAAGVASGFFLIRAEGWLQALDLARSGPHLTYGGAISVRQIAGTSTPLDPPPPE